MLRIFQKRLIAQTMPNKRHIKSNASIFEKHVFKSQTNALSQKANTPSCAIRHQLSATMIGLIVTLVVMLSGIVLVLQTSYLEKELDKRITLLRSHTIDNGLALSTELAHAINTDWAIVDMAHMNQTLQNALQKYATLNYAIVTNAEGVILIRISPPDKQPFFLASDNEANHFALERLHASHREYPTEKIIEIIHPLQVNAQKWGVLRLGFTSQTVQDEIAHAQTEIAQFTYRLILIALTIGGLFILFAYLKARNVANSVSHPLRRINESVKELTQGNFSAALQKLEANLNDNAHHHNSKDSISELTASVIEMTHDARLEQQRQLDYIASLEEALKERGIELQDAKTKLMEQGQMKASFLSAVSHELRSPLLSVMGLAQILKETFENTICPALTATNEPQLQRAISHIKDHAQTIATESQQLTALINEVLELAKMETNNSDWNIRELSIEDVIDRAMATTAVLFLDKPIQFRKLVAANLPCIQGDRERLVKVIVNLISNAAKFTEQGSVTCSAILQHGTLIIAVTDTGCGMSSEEQAKVFEKFKYGGVIGKTHSTGLGLPICKQIIAHHGGSLWLESSLNHGSTFRFSLPLADTPQHNNVLPGKRANEISFVWQSSWQALENALRSRLEQPESTQMPTLLIIDAEPDNWQWLKPNCQVQHLRLTSTCHLATELLKISIEPPDVIIVADKLPHLDGLAVAAQLRSNPATLNVPIILQAKQENKALAELLGVDYFLDQSTHPTDLLQAIHALFHASKPEKSVLVFDTDPDRRHIWLALLSCCGYDVKEAETAEHAIELAVAFTPHLIITDAELAADGDLVYRLRIELGLDKLFITLLENSEP